MPLYLQIFTTMGGISELHKEVLERVFQQKLRKQFPELERQILKLARNKNKIYLSPTKRFENFFKKRAVKKSNEMKAWFARLTLKEFMERKRKRKTQNCINL